MDSSFCHQQNDSKRYVHRLNNKGCLSIVNGNYSMANNLFELALKRCKDVSQGVCSCNPKSSLGHGDRKSGDDDSLDYCDQLIANETHSYGDNDRTDNLKFKTQRITKKSQLRTVSYPGQDEHLSERENQKRRKGEANEDHCLYHQVYQIPIVMEEEEWEMSSDQTIDFVLIFNVALCNHLMGMDLLRKETMEEQKNSVEHLPTTSKQKLFENSMAQRCFSLAQKMYAFGIEILFPFVRDIDSILYAAILNNASHVCKTIEGNNSLDAYWYDWYLVRTIYWLKVNHPKSPMGTTAPTTEAVSARAGSSRVRLAIPADRLRSIIGNLINGEAITDGYDEDNDIIDSFFENVFYLISVKKQCVPAPAA